MMATLSIHGLILCFSLWQFGLTDEERLSIKSFTADFLKPEAIADEA